MVVHSLEHVPQSCLLSTLPCPPSHYRGTISLFQPKTFTKDFYLCKQQQKKVCCLRLLQYFRSDGGHWPSPWRAVQINIHHHLGYHYKYAL